MIYDEIFRKPRAEPGAARHLSPMYLRLALGLFGCLHIHLSVVSCSTWPKKCTTFTMELSLSSKSTWFVLVSGTDGVYKGLWGLMRLETLRLKKLCIATKRFLKGRSVSLMDMQIGPYDSRSA